MTDRDDDEAAKAFGKWLFAQECRFVAGAPLLSALPPPDLLEIAFAGRSNVGKSSLINALTGRNTLARTSHTPGRTQQINFFDLGGALMLVDLPGYGYAKASKTKIADWTRLVNDFLRGRPSLRRLYLLVDSRHGPKPGDEDMMTMLDEAAVSYQLVLTKADKTKTAELDRTIEALRASLAGHVAAHPDIIVTSAREKTGVDALRTTAAALVDADELGYSPAS